MKIEIVKFKVECDEPAEMHLDKDKGDWVFKIPAGITLEQLNELVIEVKRIAGWVD